MLTRPAAASPQGRQPPAGTPACSAAPARGCHPRPALPLARVAVPTAGVAAPWQGGCQRARAVAAYARAVATATTAQMAQE
ncbi:hypothetical protein BHE74_00059579, partial [Ensete ventricosum]